jgi:hypothetical protein
MRYKVETPAEKRKSSSNGFADVKLPASPAARKKETVDFGGAKITLPPSPTRQSNGKKEVALDVPMDRGPDKLAPEVQQEMAKELRPELATNLTYKNEKFRADKTPTYQAQAYNNPNAGLAATALNRRFDVLRQKSEGQASLQEDQANSAISRGAAARGRLGSGNVVRQRMLAQKELAGQREANVNDIESQRNVAVEDQSQRESDRRMAFNQEEAGRAFQSREAAGQRNFASKEAVSQRNFEGANATKEQNFRNAVFNQQNAQFREQMDQALEQFKLDKDVTEFNKEMARNAGKSQGGPFSMDHVKRFIRGYYTGDMGAAFGKDENSSWYKKAGIKMPY